ncbi:EF-hand domain-containing protein [Oscillatoria salina]|uniref:EF-hand domain-containing protein n=1 Tax=Oscillatoria salina TaxID=331517 RepID=UPI0013B658D8|nr:EF-hand domain-containing protein [Oscillatoria salina]MBZ8181435.1 hypothetical protein [Oscillatoria salina IIICB1]NET91312.1 hypothetical protein [Kamptonema sp. SIO1D9]
MLTELQTKKWTHLFNIYDTNKNGVVNKEDYELKVQAVAKLHNLSPGSTGYDEMYAQVMADWNNLQQNVDKNQDGQITLDEWLEHGYTCINSENMYETVKKEADAIFALFDRNGDGVINSEEYTGLMKAWGVSDEGLEIACSKLNLKGDNTLSKDVFKQLLEQFHKSDDPDSPGNYLFGSF